MSNTIIESYTKSLVSAGLAPTTIMFYKNTVIDYLKYLASSNISDYTKVTLSNISDYIYYLRTDRKLENGSITYCIAGVKSFYRYLYDTNLVDDAFILRVVNRVKYLKAKKKIRQYLTKDEVKDMLEMITTFGRQNGNSTWNAFKLDAFVWFWFYTGLRLSEIINLKREHIDLSKMRFVVKLPTKNGNERMGYFNKFVKVKLERYFQYEPQKTNAFNIDRGRVDNLILSLKEFVPGKKLHAHMFRYSFGHLLARKNVNMRTAQKLLGHKSITSTEIYYDPDDLTMEQIYRDNVK